MRRRLGTLAALLALSCAVQTWMIARAVVPAQDAVRYVLMAQAYERDGLISGLKAETEHPLFPMLVWLCHSASERLTGDAGNWAFCAQLSAAAMLVLSVLFVYLLLLQLVDETAAVTGVVFYILMTPVARLGADALADSTQLALCAGALYCFARWWRTQPISMDEEEIGDLEFPISNFKSPISNFKSQIHAVWLLLAGLLIGLAMLARPEAAVLIPALVLTIGWLQSRSTHKQSWAKLTVSICALALGLGIVQAAYAAATTSFTGQSLVARVLGRDQPPAASDLGAAAIASNKGWRTPDGSRMEFGIKDRSVSTRFRGHASAAREYLRELPEAMQFWIGGLAVAGLWQLRRFPWRPFDYFSLVLFVMHSLAAIHLAADLGYLSARHLVPLVPLALAPAAYAAVHAGQWLCKRCAAAAQCRPVSPRPAAGFGETRLHYATGQTLGWATVALAAAACLPRTLAALHPTRIGHRQAGQWLAEADQPGTVLDTRGWTALYSGRPTLRYDAAKAAYRLPDLSYVVIEQRELELDSPRARTLIHLLTGAAERVAMFAAPEGRSGDNVLVYRWHPERFTEDLLVAKTQ